MVNILLQFLDTPFCHFPWNNLRRPSPLLFPIKKAMNFGGIDTFSNNQNFCCVLSRVDWDKNDDREKKNEKMINKKRHSVKESNYFSRNSFGSRIMFLHQKKLTYFAAAASTVSKWRLLIIFLFFVFCLYRTLLFLMGCKGRLGTWNFCR